MSRRLLQHIFIRSHYKGGRWVVGESRNKLCYLQVLANNAQRFPSLVDHGVTECKELCLWRHGMKPQFSGAIPTPVSAISMVT